VACLKRSPSPRVNFNRECPAPPLLRIKMPPPKFIFVRHGEAEHNVAFHEKGHAAFTDPAYRDAPLTQKGHEQARSTGKALSDYKILDIWSSPLTRAIETAEEIFEEINCAEFWLHDSLLECLGGGHACNERKSRKDLKEKFPMWKRDFLPDLPPFWGTRENFTSLHRRMLSFVLLLAHLYKDVAEGSHVVIVSHADALGALTRRPFKNAEFAVLTLEEILAPAPIPETPPLPTASSETMPDHIPFY
jgi:broad specificity phosphatase PhoE